jgi:hypothetical protein
MKTLREFGAAVILTFVLALSAVAGQTDTPPCSSPQPGQTDTPPCSTLLASGDMNRSGVASTASGDMGTPVANETSLTRIAADLLLEFLPLF